MEMVKIAHCNGLPKWILIQRMRPIFQQVLTTVQLHPMKIIFQDKYHNQTHKKIIEVTIPAERSSSWSNMGNLY